MEPTSYDVVIVGAGPGGLSCARHLTGSGLRVLVLEKNDRLGKKICSGEISPKVLPHEPFDRGHPWTEITVGTDDSRQTVRFDRPFLWTIGRFEFESLLHSKCGPNIDIRFSEPVLHISDGQVITTTGRYRFKHLVGADGSFSIVRKHLGLPTKDISGWAYHFVLDVPCTEFCMYWLPKTFPGAYGYMMSKSRHQTMAGLAWRGEGFDHKTAERAKAWIGRTFCIDTKSLRSEAMKGNADCRGWRFGNTYLVGDAGGFLNPLTTEGIYYAITSGEGVAKFILGKPEGERMMRRLEDAHKWQVLIFHLATDERLPIRWMLDYVLKDPRKGIRRRIFDFVFWKFMEA
ncbi:MAG: NAD(P)/FAD-dependent oxidoreductase [Candidatus Micrarchaeota archaeon]